MILEGKTVVVTGVGPGLGGEVARLARRDGADVVVAARNEERLQGIAAELDPSGEHVLAVATDISESGAADALVAAAVDRFGGIDGLAQIAAYEPLGGVEGSDLDEFSAAFEVNVLGSVRLVQAAVPAFRERGGGAVVLTGSQSSLKPPRMRQAGYAASKGALLSTTYQLADEFGPDHVRVNLVIPTYMWGPNVEMYVDYKADKEGVDRQVIIDEITANMCLPEIPADEDVAESVVFLMSDRARMITGQSLMVNAGELLR